MATRIAHRDTVQDTGLHKLGDIFPRLESIRDHALSKHIIPVPLVCVYGTHVPTDESYYYDVNEIVATTAPVRHHLNARAIYADRQTGGPPGSLAYIALAGARLYGLVGVRVPVDVHV